MRTDDETETKESVRDIREKLRNMNDLFFDLDDSDIDDFQDILDANTEENDDTDFFLAQEILRPKQTLKNDKT